MKYKKLLFFLIIIFFILIIHDSCSAYVLQEGGVDKFYLEGLPFSESYYRTVFLYKESTKTCMVIGCRNNSKLAYDNITKTLYHFDSSGLADIGLKVYFCTIDVINGKYIGDAWGELSTTGVGYSSYNFTDIEDYVLISNNTYIYPGTEDGVIKSLPDIEGFSWKSPFLITKYEPGDYDCKIIIPQTVSKDLTFYNAGGNAMLSVKENADGTTVSQYNLWGYTYSTDTWSFMETYDLSKLSMPANWGVKYADLGKISEYFLFSTYDVFNSNTNEKVIDKTNILFNSLYSYNSFPYILNGAEDLAKGDEDIIIMPR